MEFQFEVEFFWGGRLSNANFLKNISAAPVEFFYPNDLHVVLAVKDETMTYLKFMKNSVQKQALWLERGQLINVHPHRHVICIDVFTVFVKNSIFDRVV